MDRADSPIILIVEENPDLLDTLIGCVREVGAAIEVAARGESAMRVLGHADPALVLLSRELPDVDALGLVAQLQQGAPYRPVILLSEENSPERIVEGFAAGAADYLGKPFSNEVLEARIRHHLEIQRRIRELAARAG